MAASPNDVSNSQFSSDREGQAGESLKESALGGPAHHQEEPQAEATADTRETVGRVLKAALRLASSLKREAREEAALIRARAEESAAETRREAEETAASIKAAAREFAQEVTGAAGETLRQARLRARDIEEAAEAEAEELKASAQRYCRELKESTEKQRAELVALMRKNQIRLREQEGSLRQGSEAAERRLRSVPKDVDLPETPKALHSTESEPSSLVDAGGTPDPVLGPTEIEIQLDVEEPAATPASRHERPEGACERTDAEETSDAHEHDPANPGVPLARSGLPAVANGWTEIEVSVAEKEQPAPPSEPSSEQEA